MLFSCPISSCVLCRVSQIDKASADVPLVLYLHRGEATLYRALSAESLHKRGYRDVMHAASLRETLAAGTRPPEFVPTVPKAGKRDAGTRSLKRFRDSIHHGGLQKIHVGGSCACVCVCVCMFASARARVRTS